MHCFYVRMYVCVYFCMHVCLYVLVYVHYYVGGHGGADMAEIAGMDSARADMVEAAMTYSLIRLGLLSSSRFDLIIWVKRF